MSVRPTCPRCGMELPAGSSSWLCPKCVLANAATGEADEVKPVPTLVEGEKPKGEAPAEALPRTLGDYQLLERIGEGGMGVVYKARQLRLDRIVAVKVLPFGRLANKEYVHRFRTEAVAAGSLQHPNIVGIHEVGLDEGQHYLVMEYVAGPTLAELARQGPLPARRAARYVQLIAEAVHFAHERNILHRDLKPSNVLIDQSDQPRITDFGLAKRLTGESELTVSGQVLGSPNFMAPEQAQGRHQEVGPPSDVYSIGALLYHLLTGRPPFQAATLTEVLRQVVTIEPAALRLLNPNLPRDLETICLKCLEKEPARRYATAQDLADELGRFLRREPIAARPVGLAGKTWRWCRRQPMRASLVAALMVVFSLGLSGVLWQWNRAQRNAAEEARQRLRAEGEARRAEAGEARARQNEYVADMNLAQHAVVMNNRGRARALLEKYRPPRSSLSTLNPRPGTDLRGWEWRYLWPLCQSDALFTFSQHSNSIGVVAFAGNGRLLAARDLPGDVILWDIDTRQEIARWPHGAFKLRALALSQNGQLLAEGSWPPNGRPVVGLWEVTTRKCLAELPHGGDGVISLAFSPDGSVLATFGTDRTLRLWSLATRQVIASFPISPLSGDFKGVVAFSPDGRTLAIGETDGRIRLVSLPANLELAGFQAHSAGEGITALVFSADSQVLLSGSGYSDGMIRLWEMSTGRNLGELAGHTAWITALVLAPDGTTLASASADQTIRLWDLPRRRCRATLRGHASEVFALAFSGDGKNLASGGKEGAICFWDPQARPKDALAITLPIQIQRLAFSPDSRTFTTLNRDGSVSLWDTATAQQTTAYSGLGTNNTTLAISPDRNLMVVGTTGGTIKVRNCGTHLEVTNLVGHAAEIKHLQFCAEGRRLVSVATDRTVKLWEVPSWRERTTCRIDHQIGLFEASGDGQLAVVAEATTAELWDLAAGRQAPGLSTRMGWIDGVAFSPNGKLLAISTSDGSAKLFDLATRREVASLRGHLLGVHSLAFSPDGRRLATGSSLKEAVKLWDLTTLQEVATFEGQGNNFHFTAFSPDGNTLVSVNLQWTAHLWRAPSWADIEAAEKRSLTR